MAYVVTGNCVDCKFTDCAVVCPVSCFYEDPEDPKMLYIHPDECIDCDACVPECPVEAIYPEDEVPEEMEEYIEINAQGATAEGAVNVTEKLDPLPTAEARKTELGF